MSYSSYSVTGFSKSHNEDRIQVSFHPDWSLFAIFDGHGGPSVSDYMNIHFHVNLMKHKSFDTDIKKALDETFIHTNSMLEAAAKRDVSGQIFSFLKSGDGKNISLEA